MPRRFPFPSAVFASPRFEMASVELRDVRKSFGRVEVVHGVNIGIDDGEFVVLVGPSGCGKSTLLRMVAGLEEISSGEIRIGPNVVNNVPPKARDIAMVFQNYALYPHMTVFNNMAFSMKLAGRSQEETRGRVDKAAKILGLTEYLERYPRQLSGGQRQRVAMGRAIVRDPQVFLFDEPLSNLDAKLRVQMRTEIKELHLRLKTTSVYVTHDQIEAMTMADKIVVMNGGNVEQIGSPLELYDNPANLFVAGFIGSPAMNFLPCQAVSDSPAAVSLADGSRITTLPCECAGTGLTLGVRPEHFIISETGVPADVVLVEPTGADTQVYCKVAGSDVTVVSRERHIFKPSARIHLQPQPGKTFLFDSATGHRLA
jgi:multiple sugar transport system ATP-binding protein